CRDCNLSSQLFSQSRTHRENGSPAPALELMGNRVSASMAGPVDRAVITVVLPVFATGVYLFVTLLGRLHFLGIMPDLSNGRLELPGIGLALVHHQGQLVTGDVPVGILRPTDSQGRLFDPHFAHLTLAIDLTGHFLVLVLGPAQGSVHHADQ